MKNEIDWSKAPHDATQLRLVSHVLDGGQVEYYVSSQDKWYDVNERFHFVDNIKYRVKHTERDILNAAIGTKLHELAELYDDLLNLGVK